MSSKCRYIYKKKKKKPTLQNKCFKFATVDVRTKWNGVKWWIGGMENIYGAHTQTSICKHPTHGTWPRCSISDHYKRLFMKEKMSRQVTSNVVDERVWFKRSRYANMIHFLCHPWIGSHDICSVWCPDRDGTIWGGMQSTDRHAVTYTKKSFIWIIHERASPCTKNVHLGLLSSLRRLDGQFVSSI